MEPPKVYGWNAISNKYYLIHLNGYCIRWFRSDWTLALDVYKSRSCNSRSNATSPSCSSSSLRVTIIKCTRTTHVTPSSNLTVYHDIGWGKHRQLINFPDIAVSLGNDYCATLLVMYAFSGEDCTSAFKEKGEGGASEKAGEAPQVSCSVQAIRWGVEPQVSRAEAVGRVYLLDVRTDPRVFDGRPPCQTSAQDRRWGQETR